MGKQAAAEADASCRIKEEESWRREPLELLSVTVFGSEDTDETLVRLKEASLMLSPGEWLTVVGVNGSGKSTLARLIAGLWPERMDGVIKRGFAGDEASPIVLQQPKAQLFGETPREEIVFALEWRGIPEDRIAILAEQALHRAGLAALADEPWERLSGGQQQLAAIAAATACPARLLVMDESTSMLDEANRDAVMRAVRELHAAGTAVVWVTQRLDELGPDDRVVAVAEGQISFDGKGREFLYGPEGDVEDGAGEDALTSGDFMPLSPCLRAGLRLPYLVELALELKRLRKLSDPLPVTEWEWEQVWGNVGNG